MDAIAPATFDIGFSGWMLTLDWRPTFVRCPLPDQCGFCNGHS